MTGSFRRWLSKPALARALLMRDVLADFARQPGCAVELRPEDSICAYRRGTRLEPLSLASDATITPAELAAVWKAPKDSQRDGELRAQSGLSTDGSGFVVLDQQVAIPRAALTDPSFARLRVDLALLERTSGQLWLVEFKLADGEDLHAVPEQVRLMARLADHLVGGAPAFRDHYAEVLRQKQALGLLPAELRLTNEPIISALLIDGDRDEAEGRIVYWDLEASVGLSVHCAVTRGSVPPRADWGTLQSAFGKALASATRAPFAPRVSRHTDFARRQDELQAQSERSRVPQLGPWQRELEDYLAQHHAVEHAHLGHPRSSQAVCLQLFAPAVFGGEIDRAALSLALAPAAERAGLTSLRIDRVDFEAPHPSCKVPGCNLHLDVKKSLGEGSKHTSLDAYLVGGATRVGRAVSVGVGIEVKYTEPEFGSCGGFVSRANRSRSTCVVSDQVGDRPCHLLTPLGRAYLKQEVRAAWFAQDPLFTTGACELLGPQNQLYRSHFATAALAEQQGLDEVIFVVVFDARNETLLRPEPTIFGQSPFSLPAADRYVKSLVSERRREFSRLEIQRLVSSYRQVAGTANWVADLGRRYGWL